jgi:hypothetical protein
MADNETTFATKADILAELWLDYRNDVEFTDFIEYNDIGLPLAYAISNEIVKTTDVATRFIEETFALLLEGLDIEADIGFENLDDLLSSAEDK